MRILWISSIAWETENGYEYPTNGPGAVSGSIFQQSMIKGLEDLLKANVSPILKTPQMLLLKPVVFLIYLYQLNRTLLKKR